MPTTESRTLAALGLDAVSEAVYRSMLAHPGDGVRALAERLQRGEEEIRRSLDVLSELALVRPSYERENELCAVAPEAGINLLIARQQAELAAQQLRIEASRAAAAGLIAQYADLGTAAAHDGVEQLVGLDRIRDRITSLAHELSTEIMTFAPGGGHSPASIEASRPHDRDLLARGIRMRTVYQDSVRNSHPTVAYVEWLAELGGQVRTVPELPTRMIIFDRATALIPVSGEDTRAGAVVLTGHGTLTALCALFEQVWVQAQPLGAPGPAAGEDDALSAQEASVLRLLAQGLTDDAIAKRLGVSPRTARRVATELMDRVSARSRFEFGVRAVQNGWLAAQA